jgi:geranylgeranyl pyrophosphate synthase
MNGISERIQPSFSLSKYTSDMSCPETYLPVAHTVSTAASSLNAGASHPLNANAPLQRKLQALLLRHAPLGPNTESNLAKCLTATLSNPGSLFRAELSYRCAGVHDFSAAHAGAMAAALEYFHVASLLLDDLPAMDDSLERRGQICPHLLFGEATALLAALALITRAYGLLAQVTAEFPAERSTAAHALVERSVGVAGVVNGQARDIAFQIAGAKVLRTQQVALQKTVPLIELALALPALLAGASAMRRRELRRLSVCWGLSYQGIDDISDVVLSANRSGKTAGRDEALQRPNVLRQIGRVRVDRYLSRLERIAQHSIYLLKLDDARFAFLDPFQQALAGRRAALPQE